MQLVISFEHQMSESFHVMLHQISQLFIRHLVLFIHFQWCREEKEVQKKREYWSSNDIDYEGHELSVAQMWEANEGEGATFAFITNIRTNKNNVNEIVKLGRKRWKIENKGFNDEKNHGYGLTHAYSYDENAIKAHYMMLLMAHLFMQLLEHYEKQRGMEVKIKMLGQEIKGALSYAQLNAQNLVEILLPFQIRLEISYYG